MNICMALFFWLLLSGLFYPYNSLFLNTHYNSLSPPYVCMTLNIQSHTDCMIQCTYTCRNDSNIQNFLVHGSIPNLYTLVYTLCTLCNTHNHITHFLIRLTKSNCSVPNTTVVLWKIISLFQNNLNAIFCWV